MEPRLNLFGNTVMTKFVKYLVSSSKAVTDSCKQHGGFYLGSIGGPAAILAQDHVKKVELLEYAELGMEAVWRIEVQDFPAFILVDDKGNDFFANLCGACLPPAEPKAAKT